MKKQTLAQILTYAGALPFIGATFASIFHLDFLDLNYPYMVITYGVVIVSFISGIHWGVYLFKDAPINLFIHSNVITLIAWMMIVFSSPYSPFGLIFCLVYLLQIDRRLGAAGILEEWYVQMRMIISGIVITSLLAFIIFYLP